MTTTHANCTHPKTKPARALCRAGKAQPEGTPTVKPEAPAEKASKRRDWAEVEERPVVRHGNVSGSCGITFHERCMGGGRQWYCTCECHMAA
jgi:hypothetical protein